MAYGFVRASVKYLENLNAIVTAEPLTLAAWFNSTDTANAQVVLAVGANSTNKFWHLILRGAFSGDPVSASSYSGSGAAAYANTTSGYSSGVWHHGCAVFAAGNDRRAFIDGGSKGTDTATQSPTGVDRVRIGTGTYGTSTLAMEGKVAEAAVWATALTDEQVALLALGFSPLLVSPENLVAYFPLVRETIDLVGGYGLTAVNSPTVEDHSRIIYQRRVWGLMLPTVNVFNKSVAGSISPSGVLIKQGNKPVSGAVSPSGALIKRTARSLSGAISPSGALVGIRAILRSLSGSISPSGALIKQTARSLSGSISPVGALIKRAARSLSGVISPVGALIKRTARSLSGSISPSGALVGIRTILRSLSGSISPSGALIKRTTRSLLGTVSPSGGLVRRINKIAQGTLLLSGDLIRLTRRAIGGTITPSGSLVGLISGLVVALRRLTLPFRNNVFSLGNRSKRLTLPRRKRRIE